MSIGEFLSIAGVSVALIAFLRTRLRGDGPSFLRSLLKRLFDLAITAFTVSLVLFIGTLLLQWWYSDGISYETLKALVGYQDGVNSWLGYLPLPYVLALVALVLVVATSFAASNDRASAAAGGVAGVFLRAQPWINRLSVVAAILSSFSYLNSDGKGARLWLDLELADVKSGAAAVTDEIDSLAGTASAYELYEEIVSAVPDQNWAQIVLTAKRLADLENSIRARSVSYEGLTVKRANLLIAKELHPGRSDSGGRFGMAEARPIGAFDETYRKFSARTLSEFRDALRELKGDFATSSKGAQLQPGIRTAFVELAAKAAVAKTTPMLAPTGNAIVDLLAEAASETAIERTRERVKQLSESLKDTLRQSGGQRIADAISKTRDIFNTGLKLVFGVVPPSDGRFNAIRAVQHEAGRLSVALDNEQRGICPAGEVVLRCSRNGVSFCGSPNLDGKPC